MSNPAFEKPQSPWNVLSRMHERGRNKASTINLLAAASHFEEKKNKKTRVLKLKTPQKIHFSRRRCCTLPEQLNAQNMFERVRLLPYLPWRIPCGSFLHLLMSSWSHEAGGSTDRYSPGTDWAINFDLCLTGSRSPRPLSFPRPRARTHTDTHRDTQTRACRRSANIHQNSRALSVINSAQIGKSHVDGALALAAIAAWHGMKNDTHLLGSFCPNLGIVQMYPIGEAAPGLYGVHTWRMTRAKFAESQCDLQPASELSSSDPRRVVGWHLAKIVQTCCSTPSTDAFRTLQTKQGVNKIRCLSGLQLNLSLLTEVKDFTYPNVQMIFFLSWT